MKGRKFKKNGKPTHVVAAASPHVDKVDFATLVTYWYSKDGQVYINRCFFTHMVCLKTAR
jgi:hypothetical protein